jgi:putative DNA primase/helicase
LSSRTTNFEEINGSSGSHKQNGAEDPDHTDPSIKELIDRHGFPAFKNEKGKLSKLNEPFWAAYHATLELEALFEANEEEFYYYDELTGLFRPRSVDLIRKKLAEQILGSAKRWPALAELERFRNEPALRGILSHLRGELERQEAFCFAGKIIHLANCVLEFQPDGSFTPQPFSPKYRSRNRSPIAYDQKAECPRFKEQILGHVEPDDQELLQQYGGQCLLGRNLTQRILILDGVGGASKGTFVLVTQGIVGPANTYELRTQLLDQRFEVGRMIGKTLLLGADVKADFLSKGGASRLKSLVGGDRLEAELKTSNKQFFMSGNFNVITTSNSRLRVRLEGDQSAWQRRLTIATYEKAFNGIKIPDLDRLLLQAEGSGILNWYLEGAQKLLRSIDQTGDIYQSERQHERVKTLLLESDSLRIFLRENIIQKHSSNLTVDEIIGEYNQSCIEAGWNPLPRRIAEEQLENLMLELFGTPKSNCVKRDNKDRRGFFNVRFSET